LLKKKQFYDLVISNANIPLDCQIKITKRTKKW
jgi:hypothetical protein